eukprot:scaffold154023_cov29-Tisochrysis_lutea.AAC.1
MPAHVALLPASSPTPPASTARRAFISLARARSEAATVARATECKLFDQAELAAPATLFATRRTCAIAAS